MCTGGRSYKAPEPKPLPAPPQAPEVTTQAAAVINEGFGVTQDLTDLKAVHSLITPFVRTPKPPNPLTPQQIAERRLQYVNTLNLHSPGFNDLSDSEREYVLRRQMTQNRSRGTAVTQSDRAANLNRRYGVVSRTQITQMNQSTGAGGTYVR